MRRELAIPILLWASLSSGCGSDRPAPAAAEDAVRAAITGPKADRLRLVEFRKTDGQAKEIMGVRVYELEFFAGVDVLEDLLYEASDHSLKASESAPTLGTVQGGFSWDAWFNTAVSGREMVYQGDRVALNGTVGFERKESGWVVAAIRFKTSIDTSSRAAGHGPTSATPHARAAALARHDASVCSDQSAAAALTRVDQSGQDTTVGDAYQKEGAPGAETLSFGGWGDHYYSYVRFELPREATSKDLDAVLCLYAVNAPPNDPQLEIGVVDDSWDGRTLTIGSRPRDRIVGSFGRVTKGWNAVDVSSIVAAWTSGQRTNNGIVLVPRENNQTNGAFASGESSDESMRPRLVFRRK